MATRLTDPSMNSPSAKNSEELGVAARIKNKCRETIQFRPIIGSGVVNRTAARLKYLLPRGGLMKIRFVIEYCDKLDYRAEKKEEGRGKESR